jgi:hypothetical protein
VGTWTCTESATVTPSGSAPKSESKVQTTQFTSAGGNAIVNADSPTDPCPTKLTVSGNAATVDPGQSCTTTDGIKITGESGTFTLSANTITGTLSGSFSESANGATVSGTETISIDCHKGGSATGQGNGPDGGGSASFGDAGACAAESNCGSCCALGNFDGASSLANLVNACACGSACKAECGNTDFCSAAQTPPDTGSACDRCITNALNNDKCPSTVSGCIADSACFAYLTCIGGCP